MLTWAGSKMGRRMEVTRRDFLGAGSLAILGTGLSTPEARAAAARVGPLKITKIEAVRFRRDLRIQGIAPDWTWVRLTTDQGIVGIGESYSGAGHEAHVAVLKAYARMILGKDATDIDRLWQDLFYQISYAPWGGAETRMLSAINIAVNR